MTVPFIKDESELHVKDAIKNSVLAEHLVAGPRVYSVFFRVCAICAEDAPSHRDEVQNSRSRFKTT